MLEQIRIFLHEKLAFAHSETLVTVLLLIGIALVAVFLFWLTKKVLRIVERIVAHSDTTWDDDLFNNRMLNAIAQLAPAIAIRNMLPGLFGKDDGDLHWLAVATAFYIIWAVVYMIVVFIGNLFSAFERRPMLKSYAVKGFFQMFKLIIVGIGVIVALSLLLGKEPLAILAGFGAAAGITMLVFKDTILGLVASVQLTANKMLSKGDWIIDEKHNANGEVLDITLTAIKIKNWDNSVSTIPPYALISDSFRNYQPMRRDGGRCVQRAIYIDVNTVRFCTESELERLKENGMIDAAVSAKAQKMVNLSLLRRYLEQYLAKHPQVNHKMLTMVRQMTPTPSGLPLQLYFYTTVTEWKNYEHVQSDIFDHVYATIREFGIHIFQTPAGTDIMSLQPLSDGSQR